MGRPTVIDRRLNCEVDFEEFVWPLREPVCFLSLEPALESAAPLRGLGTTENCTDGLAPVATCLGRDAAGRTSNATREIARDELGEVACGDQLVAGNGSFSNDVDSCPFRLARHATAIRIRS